MKRQTALKGRAETNLKEREQLSPDELIVFLLTMLRLIFDIFSINTTGRFFSTANQQQSPFEIHNMAQADQSASDISGLFAALDLLTWELSRDECPGVHAITALVRMGEREADRLAAYISTAESLRLKGEAQ